MQQVIQVKSDPGHGKRKIPQKALSRRTVRSRIRQLSGQHADDMTDSKSSFCSTDPSFVILTFSFFSTLPFSNFFYRFCFLVFFLFFFFYLSSPYLRFYLWKEIPFSKHITVLFPVYMSQRLSNFSSFVWDFKKWHFAFLYKIRFTDKRDRNRYLGKWLL